MVLTVLTKNSRHFALSVFVLFCVSETASFAAEFGGGTSVGISHTDNVFLDESSSEIDDIVYQVSPFFNFVHETPQLLVNAEYAFDWYRYSDLKSTSKYHRGEVSLAGNAWQESLTAELGARRSQTLSEPDDVIPSGRLPLSGNLTDQDEWWFNPRLNRTLGRSVSVNANYRYSKIQFDNILAQENTNQSGNLGLENYSAGQGLTWALRYDWRRTDYEVSIPWEYQQATAELGFWVNAKTRVFGAGGKESAWDNPFDPAMDDSFWEAGFAHSAGENLSAEFASGERGFGSSWRGKLDYTFRRGSTSVSYNESPTTTGYNRGGAPRSVLDPDGFDDFLDRPGEAERYLSKRFQWDMSLEFRRTGFGLAVFTEDRSGRTSSDGTPLGDEAQTGARADFSWDAGVRTQFVVSGSVVDRETTGAGKSRFNSIALNANYRLGLHSDLSLGYSYSEQEPRGASSSSRDYVANVVSLFFTYTM